MKILFVVLSAVVALLLPTEASACDCCNHHGSHASAPATTTPLAAGEARVTIPVAGMHCGHCASRVEAALTKLNGVKVVDASVDGGQVVVVFEDSKTRPAKFVEAINGLGFKAGAPVQN